jgi:hypothetical protein
MAQFCGMSAASDTLVEPSVNLDRRLVFRLLGHWRDLILHGEFPSFANLDPSEIADVWPFCFALDTTEFADDPIIRVAEPAVAAGADDVIGRHVSDLPSSTLLGHACAYAQEVLRKRVPVSRGGSIARPDGTRILYRSILLPMSDDGHTICGLLGAANFREVEVTEP